MLYARLPEAVRGQNGFRLSVCSGRSGCLFSRPLAREAYSERLASSDRSNSSSDTRRLRHRHPDLRAARRLHELRTA